MKGKITVQDENAAPIPGGPGPRPVDPARRQPERPVHADRIERRGGSRDPRPLGHLHPDDREHPAVAVHVQSNRQRAGQEHHRWGPLTAMY